MALAARIQVQRDRAAESRLRAGSSEGSTRGIYEKMKELVFILEETIGFGRIQGARRNPASRRLETFSVLTPRSCVRAEPSFAVRVHTQFEAHWYCERRRHI